MASFSVAVSTLGTYTLTATYGGDDAFAPSSATETHTVEIISAELYLPVTRRE